MKRAVENADAVRLEMDVRVCGSLEAITLSFTGPRGLHILPYCVHSPAH